MASRGNARSRVLGGAVISGAGALYCLSSGLPLIGWLLLVLCAVLGAVHLLVGRRVAGRPAS